MPASNIPIGGSMLSSMLSSIFLVAYKGIQTFTPLYRGTALNIQSPYLLLDVVSAKPTRKRLLADATHTGYWYSTGKRQVGIESVIQARVKWNAGSPLDANLNILNNTMGCQVYFQIGSNAHGMDMSSMQYYWSPSMFCEVVDPLMDVSGPVPRLVEADLILTPNSPSFFINGSATDDNSGGGSSPISRYIRYITARGWSF